MYSLVTAAISPSRGRATSAASPITANNMVVCSAMEE